MKQKKPLDTDTGFDKINDRIRSLEYKVSQQEKQILELKKLLQHKEK